MPDYSIRIFDSVDKLLAEAGMWNSLWARTGTLSPLGRAECIAQWMSRFAPNAAFRAVVVEENGTAVAGIPLCLKRRVKILRIGLLPGNEWGRYGDLLCEAARPDTDAIFSHLVSGLKQLPIDFLWGRKIRYEQFPWKNFREYWTNSGKASRTIMQHHTAVVPLHGEPETVVANWNKVEIANIKRRFRKRFTPENHEFRIVSHADDIAALLPECFAVEHASWKGQEDDGGSIIKKNMAEYYTAQAKMLAEQNLLRLYALFLEKRLIAFQYNYLTGKTVFSMKIGYDPALREFAPGIILQWLINQTLLEDRLVDEFDCMGIAGAYQKIWNPELHAVGEVIFPLSLLGKAALSLHKLYNKMR